MLSPIFLISEWWNRQGKGSSGGKPLFLPDRNDTHNQLYIFFDDHISRHKDDHHGIVDVRASSGEPMPLECTLDVHALRVDTLGAIESRDYFVRRFQDAEDKFLAASAGL